MRSLWETNSKCVDTEAPQAFPLGLKGMLCKEAKEGSRVRAVLWDGHRRGPENDDAKVPEHKCPLRSSIDLDALHLYADKEVLQDGLHRVFC